MFKEENPLKKRKKEFNANWIFAMFNSDFVLEIANFLPTLKDYFNFAKINKFTFEKIMKKDISTLNELLKRDTISNINFPDYLRLNLTCLNLIKVRDVSNLKHFINLKYLKIDDWAHQQVNDEVLKSLLKLEEVEMQDCVNVKGECFTELKDVKILTVIYKEGLQCFKFNAKHLSNLIQLTQLIITEGYKKQEYLPKLTCLEVLRTDFLKEKDLTNLRNLKELAITNDKQLQFNGESFMYLSNLESLRLHNPRIKIKEENLIYLANLKKLYIGELNGEYLCYLTKLEKLTFTSGRDFKEEYLQTLINLQYLVIQNNLHTFTGIYLNNFENLTHLGVKQTNVKDDSLKGLVNLTYLDLSFCLNVTGICLMELINLKYLDISGTKIRKGKYLSKLSQLVTLKANNCPRLVKGKFLLELHSLREFKNYDKTYEGKELLELKLCIKEKQTLSQIAESKKAKEETTNNSYNCFWKF